MTHTIDNKPALAGLKFWFGAMVVIGPIHMGEQLMFGLDQLAELKSMLAAYHARFTNPDAGTVLLVIIAFTLVQTLLYAMLAGGRWQLFAAGFFGALAAGEGHHIVQSLAYGEYFPGMVTSIPFMAIGVMILRAVVREWRAAGRSVEGRLAFE